MPEKIKQFILKLNVYGIPVPLLRDPKSKGPSVSLTLLFISSLFVEAGLIGKFTKLLDGIDINQAINWFLICSGLYLGRSLSTKSVTSNTDKDENVKQD